MDELIKISYGTENPTVSARDLHEALEVKTAYKDWFPRMCEYGFEERKDFCSILSESTGGRPAVDHQITIPMAKEICMLQRTPKGKEFRQYFIAIEEKWNSPESVMSRALQFANQCLDNLKQQNLQLTEKVAVNEQIIQELQPKASYYDVVLNCKDLLSITKIAKDYGKSAIWLNNLLHDLGVQFKQGDIWLLYQKYASQGYTSTKTHSYNADDGTVHSKVQTYWTQKGRLFIYELLKNSGYLPLIEMEDKSA